ncbi:MAG: helix-turn-helix transcriptional regulator [Acidobacteriota bacterium]
MARGLTRAQLKVRMLRALSGQSQKEFEQATKVANVTGMENGQRHPTAAQIALMCESLGISTDDCETLLQDYEARVARHQAAKAGSGSAGPEPPLVMPANAQGTQGIASILEEAEARLGRAGEERAATRAAEREQAKGPWERLRRLESFDEMVLVARSSKELQTWAVVELICDESARMASAGDRESAGRARNLAELAVEVAGRIRATDAWRTRVRGFAMAHLANALHASGEGDLARETMEEAERLWEAGQDPEQILDPGRFHDLVGSISFSDAT